MRCTGPRCGACRTTTKYFLADSEETYSFLRQILTAASAPYRSKRIHIGMDEAHGVGMGAHLRLHGYEKPYDILRRHLKRVLDIVNELGLSPMMWSDMYFRPESPHQRIL